MTTPPTCRCSLRSRVSSAEVVFLAFANAVDLGDETDGAIAWPLPRGRQAVARHTEAPFLTVQDAFSRPG